MIPRPLLTGLGALLFPVLPLAAADGKLWTSDYDAARKQAAEQKKDLLLDFTGSDWCGWCIKLKEEVFDHDAFKKGVADKFVLVELDFPRDESKLTAELKARNEKLAEKYAVEGFPAIILADPQGRPYAQTGYQEGGPAKYLAHLDELRKTRTARDEDLAAAAKLEGVEKARKLLHAIADYPDPTVEAFYPEIAKQIVAADPKDETGFHKAREYRRAIAAYEESIGKLFEEGKFDEAIPAADAFIARHEPTGIDKQHILMAKVMALVETGQKDPALKQLDTIKAIAPESEIGTAIDGMKDRLIAHFASQAPAPPKTPETPKAPEAPDTPKAPDSPEAPSEN